MGTMILLVAEQCAQNSWPEAVETLGACAAGAVIVWVLFRD
jgi:hypothetical protein